MLSPENFVRMTRRMYNKPPYTEINCPRSEFGEPALSEFFNTKLCSDCNPNDESAICWTSVRDLLVSKYHFYNSLLNDETVYNIKSKKIEMTKENAFAAREKILSYHKTAEKICTENMRNGK